MQDKLEAQLTEILLKYDPEKPRVAAEALRSLWLQYEPKSIDVIKAELREQQETVGIPVPMLKSIAEEISKLARKQVDDYLPLMQMLWNEYGREGRVVALVSMGAMELTCPALVAPAIKTEKPKIPGRSLQASTLVEDTLSAPLFQLALVGFLVVQSMRRDKFKSFGRCACSNIYTTLPMWSMIWKMPCASSATPSNLN